MPARMTATLENFEKEKMEESRQDTEDFDHVEVQWQDTSDGETDGTEGLADSFNESNFFKDSDIENDEVMVTQADNLSHVLQSWMPNYVLTPIQPQTIIEKEPLYSAKLGDEPRVKRTLSCESITTQLSLLSCSTYGKRNTSKVQKRRTRKGTGNRPITCTTSSGDKWGADVNHKHGMFDKMFRQGDFLERRNMKVFEMTDEHEKKLLRQCSLQSGPKITPGLKKSESSTNISRIIPIKPRRFSCLDAVPHQGRDTDMKQNERLLSGSNRSLNTPGQARRLASPMPKAETPALRMKTPLFREKVKMWQVDERMMNVDSKLDLSPKTRKRIASTNLALERVSRVTGTRPNTMPESSIRTKNFSNVQKIRISPELSNVIQEDIKMRMGRPRYHEIKKQDIQMWDRGHELSRSHRNLKIFNWLNSLQEDEYGGDLQDELYTEASSVCGFVHVEAVDEPKL